MRARSEGLQSKPRFPTGLSVEIGKLAKVEELVCCNIREAFASKDKSTGMGLIGSAPAKPSVATLSSRLAIGRTPPLPFGWC